MYKRCLRQLLSMMHNVIYTVKIHVHCFSIHQKLDLKIVFKMINTQIVRLVCILYTNTEINSIASAYLKCFSNQKSILMSFLKNSAHHSNTFYHRSFYSCVYMLFVGWHKCSVSIEPNLRLDITTSLIHYETRSSFKVQKRVKFMSHLLLSKHTYTKF